MSFLLDFICGYCSDPTEIAEKQKILSPSPSLIQQVSPSRTLENPSSDSDTEEEYEEAEKDPLNTSGTTVLGNAENTREEEEALLHDLEARVSLKKGERVKQTRAILGRKKTEKTSDPTDSLDLPF